MTYQKLEKKQEQQKADEAMEECYRIQELGVAILGHTKQYKFHRKQRILEDAVIVPTYW